MKRRNAIMSGWRAGLAALALLLGSPLAQAGNTVTTVTYVYTNPQGTPLARANAQGQIIARYDYRPYGAQQDGPATDGPGYTGHVNDVDTGLVYMQQRYYDPETQRFLSVDPVGPTPGNLYSFNRYDYANNNPVRFTDPFGLYACHESKSDCDTIESYYRGIEKTQSAYKEGSSAYNSIQGVLDYLGKPDKDNGVTVAVKSFHKKNKRGNNDKHTINIDLGKISGDAKNPVWANRNEGFTANGLAAAIGAGVLAHEGQHGVDALNSGWSWPTKRSQEMGTEISAYSTESLIQGSLHVEYGLWGNGWVPSTVYKAIRSGAEASTRSWCDASPGAEGC